MTSATRKAAPAQRPVTILATRRVRPGREREFEAFLTRLREVFTNSPGNLGIAVVPPTGPDREYPPAGANPDRDRDLVHHRQRWDRATAAPLEDVAARPAEWCRRRRGRARVRSRRLIKFRTAR